MGGAPGGWREEQIFVTIVLYLNNVNDPNDFYYLSTQYLFAPLKKELAINISIQLELKTNVH